MAGMTKKNKNSQSGRKRNNKKNMAPMYGAISNGSIKRIARRAGIKRISADSFSTIRDSFETFVDRLVIDAYNYTECGGRKTIQP